MIAVDLRRYNYIGYLDKPVVLIPVNGLSDDIIPLFISSNLSDACLLCKSFSLRQLGPHIRKDYAVAKNLVLDSVRIDHLSWLFYQYVVMCRDCRMKINNDVGMIKKYLTR